MFGSREKEWVLRGFLSAILVCGVQSLARAEQAPVRTLILPRPVVEIVRVGKVMLAGKGEVLRVAASKQTEGAVGEGLKLLERRTTLLGSSIATGDDETSSIVLKRCSPAVIVEWPRQDKLALSLEPSRMRQAYHLSAGTTAGGSARVTIEAPDDWGLFYGLVSLCQLLELDGTGVLRVPAVEIVDYPEIAHRLAKTSASNPPAFVSRLAAWLPFLKISQIGLQYHGNNSKQPKPEFTNNIKTVCPRLRSQGTVESIVYFCPFRGEGPKGTPHPQGAYDLAVEADRAAYADYLLWIMAQGAHGIEVDYNDWPGSKEVPVATVLNMVCDTVKKRYPNAYILYCPSARGNESYRGPASPELRQTLSQVPAFVWPLWTGPKTLISDRLRAVEVEQWTRDAGRRPFLWINRSSVGVKVSFSHKVPGTDGYAFAGDMIPHDLNRLFEGVHLNTGTLSPALIQGGEAQTENELAQQLDPHEIAYLATTSDFLWNPRTWDATESYRRAVRFVEIMRPLLSETGSSQKIP